MWNYSNKAWCSRVKCLHSLSLYWEVSVRWGTLLFGWWKPAHPMLTCVVSYSREVMTCEIGEGMCIGRWLRFDTVSRSHTGGSLILMPFDLGGSHTKILYCISKTVECRLSSPWSSPDRIHRQAQSSCKGGRIKDLILSEECPPINALDRFWQARHGSGVWCWPVLLLKHICCCKLMVFKPNFQRTSMIALRSKSIKCDF